jgi:hypothetical protein
LTGESESERVVVMKEGSITLAIAAPETEARKELAPITGIRQLLPNLQVDTHEQFAFAGELASQLQKEKKRILEARDGFIGPAKEWVKLVTESYRHVLEAYDAALAEVKRKQAAYSARIEAERTAAMLANAPAAAPPPPEVKGTTVRKVKKIRIVSEKDVPREFCTPDLKAIAAWYEVTGGESIPYPKGIPGVETYEEHQVITRAAK